MEGSKEGFAQFVVASGNAAEMFELIEEALDTIALPIKLLVVGDDFASSVDGWDHRLDAVISQAFPDAIGIIAFVQGGRLQDIVRIETLVETLELPAVVGVTGAQMQSHAAVFIDSGGMDLRA